MRRCLLFLLLCFLVSTGLHADGPAFDLSGPKVDVHVKRGDVTLPISETPNLLPGDRLWIHPDLPESQSTHFVLVVAFLRGATNPPPPEWFTRVETWTRDARDEGVFVTVPAEAQQALIFLAPETGGDFNTLRKAVHDRPGAFIRAAQDLQAASWDRMRVEAYLAQVKATSQTDPKSLKEHAEMAARSLGVKINQDCFDRPVDQQVSCLSQNSDRTGARRLQCAIARGANYHRQHHRPDEPDQLLEHGRRAARTAPTSAPSLTPPGFSPHSIPRISSTFPPSPCRRPTRSISASTRRPRFAIPSRWSWSLCLHSGRPGLSPSIRSCPADDFCAQKPGLVLPAEGAPMVFASQLGPRSDPPHRGPAGSQRVRPSNCRSTADPSKGGLVLKQPAPSLPPGELVGVIHGKWGFDDWTGPQFHLLSPQPGGWTLAAADQSALVVGREDILHFDGQDRLCIDKVEEHAGQETSGQLTGSLPSQTPCRSPFQ